jgi:hypothetical protein
VDPYRAAAAIADLKRIEFALRVRIARLTRWLFVSLGINAFLLVSALFWLLREASKGRL